MWNESHVNELAAELSPYDLARALLGGLEENEVEPTVENGKKLWLDILQNELPEAIESTIKYAPAFN